VGCLIKTNQKISRREAIKSAGLLLGVSIPLSQLDILASSFAANKDDFDPQFLGRKNFILLQQISDLVIPRTDTPGAIDAGVHIFIDLMLNEWASEKTKVKYLAGFKDINNMATISFGASFVDCTKIQKIGLIESLDVANSKFDNDSQIFFRDLKWFIISGYYSSEEGASVELNYDRMPGKYQGCLPFSEQDKAWSA